MKVTDQSEQAVWKEFAAGEQLAAALAAKIAMKLASAIDARGSAVLCVSGGSTPKTLFKHLSKAVIDWQNVIVTLVDERYVPPENDRSNQRLVSTHLLQNTAATAQFQPLYFAADTADGGAKAAQQAIDQLHKPFDVVVLGMGGDGHTASFFPGGDNLSEATDLSCSQSVMTMAAPNAGEPRITLTLPVLVSADLLVLHIEGMEKKGVLLDAMKPGPIAQYPVRAVLRSAGPHLRIYWAP